MSNLITLNLGPAKYTYDPDKRDLLAEIVKAEAKARRDIKRGHPLVRNAPVPVFPNTQVWWKESERIRVPDNLLGRTVAWVKQQWETTDHVTIHLFRPGPSDRQCKRFNDTLESELGSVAKPGQKLTIKYVSPEDWGFGPKEKQ